MAKRHRWSRGNGWTVCEDCGCRYRHGNFDREYEQPNHVAEEYGHRTTSAMPCVPRSNGEEGA